LSNSTQESVTLPSPFRFPQSVTYCM